MDILFIILIALGAALGVFLLLFLIYLFLIAPGARRAATDEFKDLHYAHRGLHGEGVAENSITAFEKAASAGFGIELDVRLSRDGVLVVFHDDTLTRVTGKEGKVIDFTFEELSKIRLSGTEDTVPSFEEVLATVGGRVPILVELKEDAGSLAVTEAAVEMLRTYSGKFLIESFNPLAIARVKKLMPEAVRGVLADHFTKNESYRKPLYFLLQNLVINVIARPDFIAFNKSHPKMLSLRLTRMLGAPSIAWTVKSQAEEDEAKKHGFSGIIFEGYIPKEN